MLLTELKLRQIIRKKILKEYSPGRQESFTWQKCEKIDLPDHLFKTPEGRNTVKSAEKHAAFVAQVYGVPGFVCDIFSSLIGDNPNRELNSDRRSKNKQQTINISTVIYSETLNEIKNKNIKSKFIVQTIANINKTEIEVLKAALITDMTTFNNNILEINNAAAVAGNPIDLLKEVNQILDIPPGNSRRIVKKMIEQEELDNNIINSMIANQSIAVLKHVTLNNLIADNVSEKYTVFTEYTNFKALCQVNST
jgi:hypothetical protein